MLVFRLQYSSSSSSSFDLVARQNSQTGVQILRRVTYNIDIQSSRNLMNKHMASEKLKL